MLGMSREKLAEALGLTFQQIQKYGKRANRIGASRQLQIAGILDVSIELFFAGCHGFPASDAAAGRVMAEVLISPHGDRLVRGFLRLKDDEIRKEGGGSRRLLASPR
ncbi:helix-turn-helix domain-containing protein [Microvirga sp. TS319]|uniref:helix-turn-helix domain-containing protein n=1 Tax=Microvirga sp. TS319 TaxID=3241165 RepID=UPI00351A1063